MQGTASRQSASSDYTALQACSAVSLPLCPAVFPTNTPLVCFNSCATNTSNLQGFSSSVWFLTVDCNYVAGAIGVRNYYAQENSGLYHDTVINCANNGRGIDIGKSSGTNSGSGYHSTLWRLNVGNATPSNGGTAVCQIGGVNMYLASTSGSSVVNPSSISEVTTSNFGCDASFGSFKWPLPQYQWEVGGANISIHDVHQEYIGLAGMLVGGATTGLGAQVSVTTSGGAVNNCTIVNRGEGYSMSAPTNFPVYATAGSGGSVTVTWGTAMTCSGSGAGNCVQTCVVGSGGTLYPTSGLLAPIYDAVSTGGAQSVLLTNVETCCAETYQSTDAIRLQSGATIHGFNALNINGLSGGPGAPTNLINDQNHLPIVTSTHAVVAQYGLDDLGKVFMDTTGTNPMTFAGTLGTGGTASAGTLGVPNMVYASNSSSIVIPATYGAVTLLTTPPGGGTRGFEISHDVEQSGAGTGCTGATNPAFQVNYIYTPVGAPASTTVSNTVTISANTGNGANGAVLLQIPPQILQAKVSTAIQVSVTNTVSGSGCTTQPAYTVYSYLKQLD